MQEMPGRIVSKDYQRPWQGMFSKNGPWQHFHPTCSWRTGYFLIKRWSLSPLPEPGGLCSLALTNRGSQEWCCVIPEALRKPCTLSCSTVLECTSGAWISMEEVPLLWGHSAGETTEESEGDAQGVPGCSQPTSLWVSLPGTRPREVRLQLIQPQHWWQKCCHVSQL